MNVHANVIRACHQLVDTGLIARTWGNVSCRLDEHHYVITPSGRDYKTLTEDDLVIVNIDDGSYDKSKKPSGEKGMHTAIYQKRPLTSCIIHTHQNNASVIGATSLKSIQLDAFPKGHIMIADYGLPSTKKLADNVVRAIDKSEYPAIIMKKHGAVLFGDSMDQVFALTHQLEDACKEYLEQRINLQTIHEEFTTYPMTIKPNDIEDAFSSKDLFTSIFSAFQDIEAIGISQIPEVKWVVERKETVRPLLDDFAQLIGVKVDTGPQDSKFVVKALKANGACFVEGIGALFIHKDLNELSGMRMVLEKNVKAWVSAHSIGKVKPINKFESILMRVIYLQKYAKQKGDGHE